MGSNAESLTMGSRVTAAHETAAGPGRKPSGVEWTAAQRPSPDRAAARWPRREGSETRRV